MEIRNYVNILWRRKFIVLLTLVTTMVVVVLGTRQVAPVYEASAKLRVATSAGGSINYSDYMYADRLMNTYVQIATSKPVLEELKEELALTEPPEIKAEIVPNTELIKLTVENTNPSMAANIANTLANVLATQSNQLFLGGGKRLTEVLGEELTIIQSDFEKTQREYETLLLQTPAPENMETTRQLLQLKQTNYITLLAQYEQARFREEIQASMVTVFETATVPETPSRPRLIINIALGFFVGLMGGLGLAFLFENLDTTLYEIEDIETITKLPILEKIPKAHKREIGTIQEGFSPLAESFRNLATNLQLTDHKQKKKVLLLMSAEPNQGKSTVTFHLAHSLAELGNTIVAVDCDTRIPRLHSYFNLPNETGLKDILEKKASLEDALQKTSFKGIKVLTSGSRLAHPTLMLGSVQMAALVKSLTQQCDYVLLDSPAMLAAADVSALAPIADCLLLVVRQAHAQRDAVQAAGNYLAKQDGKLTFLIVTQAGNTSHYYYYKDRKNFGSKLGFVKKFSRKVNRNLDP